MYYESFSFRGELMCLNCEDICMCLVNKQFEPLGFVFKYVYVDLLYNEISLTFTDGSVCFAQTGSIYCICLYCCEWFNYNSKYISELYVSWRKVIRKKYNFPMRTHNYIVCSIEDSVNIKSSNCKVYFNVIHSNNISVTLLINIFLNCKSSVFADNYIYIIFPIEIIRLFAPAKLTIPSPPLTYTRLPSYP